MKFNSQICTTKEQSQKLLELGLKPETADMYHSYIHMNGEVYPVTAVRDSVLLSQDIPAWSLHRLLCIASESYLSMNLNVKKSDLYSDIIAIIEKLIKQGKINKEYLCEQ